MKISKVLCCVNNDPLADSAFELGYDLAQKLGAEFGIASILDSKLLQAPESGVDTERLRAAFKNEIDQLFARLLKKRPDSNIAKFCEDGDPKKLILEVANNWNTDLIVIASHSRKGISRVLMGSVAESVLRHAKCPVLIVPANY
ncbi:MAG: universal stress protein [Pseudobdellovibrionaceae bacterium]